MRRQLLSSLLGCRIVSSATALLFLGHTFFLHHYTTTHYQGRRREDHALPPAYPCHVSNVKRNNVALCERRIQNGVFTNEPSRQKHVSDGDLADENLRTRQTTADLFFSKYGWLPLPKTMHKVLSDEDDEIGDRNGRKNILVIGDVHGCFEELQLLHKAAIKANGYIPFRFVILVGDICNKGPHSTQVIRFVRKQPNWLTVRGNHDNAALSAALGHRNRRRNPKYAWVKEGENATTVASSEHAVLSDKDIMWMSELPYTVTIPASMLGEDETVDTVIVHAGFIPGVNLKKQNVENMIHLRNVVEVHIRDGIDLQDEPRLRYTKYLGHKRDPKKTEGEPHPVPWAAAWKGPERVIFGHDAKRGFQRYDGDWAIGLDTGACYGKQLTGIILPQRHIVSVNAVSEHVPIVVKQDS